MKKKNSYEKRRKMLVRVVAIICAALILGSVLVTALFTAGAGA
ncbi:MAG: hypothetical protein ACI4IS_03910 [Acutalibacteraceae bacterium]